MAGGSEDRYVTAAGRLPGLTRFYDTIVAVTTRERLFRGQLADQVAAGMRDDARVADVGAGTGTFAIAYAAAHPGAEVVAVDGDPEALRIAGGKSGSRGGRVEARSRRRAAARGRELRPGRDVAAPPPPRH